MSEMANYPKSNVTSTVMHPPSAGPGYPQPGGYPPADYPPGSSPPQQDGYPPPAPMTNPPVSGAGYPTPGNRSQPGKKPPSAEGNWMLPPIGVPMCPPGLEYLAVIDQLLVDQKIALLEAFLGFESNNKYLIKNNLGQLIYIAKEDTDCCTRTCGGSLRPFLMDITDNTGNEVIEFYRPYRCDSCCCPCCLQEMEVMAPPGTVIGSVVQEWSICYPNFKVQNAAGETVLCIEGPLCPVSIRRREAEFKVLSKDGETEVGCIRKQWSDLLTDADQFGITFPMDLDVNIKAVLLGACMLIDFMFFEEDCNKR